MRARGGNKNEVTMNRMQFMTKFIFEAAYSYVYVGYWTYARLAAASNRSEGEEKKLKARHNDYRNRKNGV